MHPPAGCAPSDIALAGIDRELHPDLGALIQGAQDKLRIENDNIAHRLDVAGGNRTGTLLLDHHPLGPVPLHLDRDVFDVEHDVSHVLADAWDG